MAAGDENGGQSHIVIGLRDVYDQVMSLGKVCTELGTKMDVALQTQALQLQMLIKDLSEQTVVQQAQEHRIRALETQHVVTPKSMWTGVGVIVGVAAILASVMIAILK